MPVITQPLRDEHKELLPHIHALREAADLVGQARPDVVHHAVDEAHDFLSQHLLRHARAEEQALYPVVGRLMGSPRATATMERDHVEIARLTDELGRIRSELPAGAIEARQERPLRAVLYGLSALVTLHFAKEEEVYLPVLDEGLTEAEGRLLFETMEAAAAQQI